ARAVKTNGGSDNPAIVAMRIYSLSELGADEAIRELLDNIPLARTDPQCIIATAEHAFSKGDYGRAIRLAEPFVDGENLTALSSLELLARALIAPILDRRQSDRTPIWTLSQDE